MPSSLFLLPKSNFRDLAVTTSKQLMFYFHNKFEDLMSISVNVIHKPFLILIWIEIGLNWKINNGNRKP